MKIIKHLTAKIGVVACGALVGCTTYVERQPTRVEYYPEPQPPRQVYVSPPVASVPPRGVTVSVGFEIHQESDFYEPLSPYGRWEVVGSHGRCWIPMRVEANWRPYCNGNWERTDAGWYWASDEPWAWATYHYGRWDLSPQFGWYWVPQTQWAPAWVSWHSGGGYVGWAPLQPSVRALTGGSISVNVALIAPRAFVFVQPGRFLQPVRPATVVVNNTTIINQTVNITNIKIVNNTVINEGPQTQIIERASGQKVRPVPARELRRKQEAEVVTRLKGSGPKGSATNSKTIAAQQEIPSETVLPKADGVKSRVKHSETIGGTSLQPHGEDLKKRPQPEASVTARELNNDREVPRREVVEKAQSNSEELDKINEQRQRREAELLIQAQPKEAGKKAQKEDQSRAQELGKINEQKQRREAELLAQERAQQKEAAAKAQQRGNGFEKRTRPISGKVKIENRVESPKDANGSEVNLKQEAPRIVQPLPVIPQETTKNKGSEQKVRGTSATVKPSGDEKSSTNTLKKAQKSKGKRKPALPEENLPTTTSP